MGLDKYTKQPADVQDYDVDYASLYLDELGDTAPGPTGLTVTADTGITVNSYALSNGIAKAWLSGGTHGTTYKVTFTVVTAGGRTKQHEIAVKVKET